MARIIVFHFSPAARVPQLSATDCAAIRQNYETVIKNYPGVVFHGVSVGPDGRGICEWEAPSVGVVCEIVTKVDGRPPLDGAVEVQKII